MRALSFVVIDHICSWSSHKNDFEPLTDYQVKFIFVELQYKQLYLTCMYSDPKVCRFIHKGYNIIMMILFLLGINGGHQVFLALSVDSKLKLLLDYNLTNENNQFS